MNSNTVYQNRASGQGQVFGTVISRSMNDPARVDEIVRQASSRGKTIDFLITGMAVLFIVIGIIARSSEKQQWWTAMQSNRFDQSTVLFSVGVFALLLGLILFIPTNKAMRGLNAKYDEYRRACSYESMMVEEQMVYGMINGTEFRPAQQYSIPIKDIKVVTIQMVEKTVRNVSPIHYDELDLNEVLSITDNRGNVYKFISFANCNELKNVIERLRMFEKTGEKTGLHDYTPVTVTGQNPSFGNVRSEVLSDGSWICWKCETKNPANASFCRDCGAYKK